MKLLFSLFSALFFILSLAAQPCNTFAGSPQSFFQDACEFGSFLVPPPNDAVLDGNDALIFVAHDGSASPLGNVIAWNSDGFFEYSPLFVNGVTYHVAAVAGNTGGTFGVDLTDTCLSVSPLGTVVFHPIPDVSCIGGTIDCQAPFALMECLGNDPPYTFLWSNGNIGSPTQAWAPGVYSVSVTNAFGCVTTETVVVTQDNSFPTVSIIPPQALPCNGSQVLLESVVTGGSGNFTFQWFLPDSTFANSQTLLVDEPGLYCLVVTDVTNGCQSSGCVVVNNSLVFFPEGNGIACRDSIYDLITYSVTPNFPVTIFIQKESEVPEQHVVTEPTNVFPIEIDTATTFLFWATDAAGCTSDTFAQIVIPSTIEIDFTVEQNGCNPALVTANIIGDPPAITYKVDWSNGASGNAMETSTSGWYFVSVTNDFGCTEVDSIYLTVDYSGVCAYIEGTVEKDSLDNCTSDAGEVSLAGWLVVAEGVDTFFATTDAAGFYSIPVDPGSYTVGFFPPNPFWSPCQNGVPVTVANVGDVANADFLVQQLPGCPLMEVDISTPFLRRCFSSNYYVSYCNFGVETATDAYLELNFDPYLSLTGASLPYADLGNNVYRFDLGEVEAGECGFFDVTVLVSCDAVLGQTHCTEAHIFPDTTCIPADPNWSGANLEIEAECTDSLRFIIKNTGTGSMTSPLEYVVIEDAVMYAGTGDPLQPGGEMVITKPANGSTWRLEVEQEPFHPDQPNTPALVLEGCGGISAGFVNQFPLSDPQPWLDIDCTQNVGSYDPNDKQGFPTGYASQHFIEPGTDIEYLIRFQNTGTDTAFNVVIRDTLSSFFDVTSVRPGASSHAYNFEVYGTGILKFTFPNILLPDSSDNEPASHGFVSYRVSQRPDVPLGAVIENRAGIYFDFNEPVLTNTTWHTVGENFVVNGVRSDFEGVEILVSPNPVAGSARVELKGLEDGKALTFSVLDVVGSVVRMEEFAAPAFEFERRDLEAGMYFFNIEQAGRLVAFGKMVLQ